MTRSMRVAGTDGEATGTPLLFASLHGYRRDWFGPDLIAGLTVWAVLVPEALAYATIAGVSPVIGLYAAPPALLLYAVFGSSRHLVTGPMAATAALSAAAVADHATDDGEFLAFTVVLALVTGLIALLAGILRFGFIANFISEPVLRGFIIGLALTIIVGQLPKLFGVEGGEGDFFEKLGAFLGDAGETDPTTLVIGVLSLLIVLGCRRWLPAVPGSLLAVAFGIGSVMVFDLGSQIDIVGDIEAGLPELGLPDAGFADYLAIAPAAVGVMLVGFVEGLGAAKTYASRFHYDVDPNRELMGLGVANLGSGLSSGMVVNGSLSKTAVNAAAGARTQMSGLIVAALTIVTLLFLTELFADLPEATLAAIVIAALIELVDVAALRRLFRASSEELHRIYGRIGSRPDFYAALAALVGVLIFDTLPGLFIGIATSIVLLIYRSSRPNVARLGLARGTAMYVDVDRHPDVVEQEGILVVRVESGLFFANSEFVRHHIETLAGDDVHAVVLDAVSVPFVDLTATQMLGELIDALASRDITLLIARDVGQVRDVLAVSGEEPHSFPSVRAAIEAYEERRLGDLP